MLQSIEPFFIGYLALIRLAAIAAGVVIIRYGYKLFVMGVFQTVDSGQTEISGRVGKYELSLKTASPGAILGFFGAVLLVSAIVFIPPELRHTSTRDITKGEGEKESTTTTVIMRTGRDREVSQVFAQGDLFFAKDEYGEALKSYQEAMRLLSTSVHNLVMVYLEQARYEEAWPLAEMLVQYSPQVPAYKIVLEKIKRELEAQ